MIKTTKQQTKLFRVNKETGSAFVATAELIGVNENDLLEDMMTTYIKSIQTSIADVAAKYPQFANRYPFIR